MSTVAALLAVADAYAAAAGLAEATVSRHFLGASHRLRTIREGGDIGARRIEAALADFSGRWPEGAAWPADVPRPAPAAALAADQDGEAA